MRNTIENRVTAAIRDGENLNSCNTSITHKIRDGIANGKYQEIVTDMTLHGHHIYCRLITPTETSISVSLAGWNTVTTRARLHAALVADGFTLGKRLNKILIGKVGPYLQGTVTEFDGDQGPGNWVTFYKS